MKKLWRIKVRFRKYIWKNPGSVTMFIFWWMQECAQILTSRQFSRPPVKWHILKRLRSAGSWGQWGGKFTRSYLVLLGPSWWVAVFLSCLASQHLKLFSCSWEACDTGGIFPLAGAYWHVGTLLGWWETRVSAPHKDRNIPFGYLQVWWALCRVTMINIKHRDPRVALLPVSVCRCRGIIL